jgi:multidrug transporter EmrE-like cation transporter
VLNISKPVADGVLLISIVFEIIGTSCLKACHGFQDKKLTAILIVCYLLSFGLFAKVLHLLNLAVAYATWTAMGSLGCIIVGWVFFGQRLTVVGWISMLVMCIGVFLLNLHGTPPEEEAESC